MLQPVGREEMSIHRRDVCTIEAWRVDYALAVFVKKAPSDRV